MLCVVNVFLFDVTVLFIALKLLSHSDDEISIVLMATNNGFKYDIDDITLVSLYTLKPYSYNLIVDASST